MDGPNFLSVPSAPSEQDSENSETLEAFEANLRSTVNDDDASSTGLSQADDADLPLDGDDEIPQRFINGCVGDTKEARRRWELTKRWRREKSIDSILQKPQPNFAFIKKHYPHHLHGRSKSGYYVYIEQPGLADFAALWRNGVTMEDVVNHYVFITEYLWTHIDPRPDGMLCSIFDLKGCKMGALAGNVLKLFKKCSAVMQAHYPERSHKLMLINAPWWFNSAYAIVAPFIDPRTKKKLNVYGKQHLKHLLEEIDKFSIPVVFGGSDTVSLGESEPEQALRKYVENLNAEHNVTFFMPEEPDEPLSKSELKKLEKERKAKEKEDAKAAKKAGK